MARCGDRPGHRCVRRCSTVACQFDRAYRRARARASGKRLIWKDAGLDDGERMWIGRMLLGVVLVYVSVDDMWSLVGRRSRSQVIERHSRAIGVVLSRSR